MSKNSSNNTPVLTKKEQALLFGSVLVILVTLFSFSGKQIEQEPEKSLAERKHKTESKVTSEKQGVKTKEFKIRNPSNTGSKKDVSKVSVSKNPFESELSCIKSQSCDLPQDDPRAYMLAAYKNLSKAIKQNKNYFLTDWNNDKKALLESFFKLPDGFIKQEALNVALELSKTDSQKLLKTVTEEVLHYHDSELIKDTLTFLNKTMTSGNEQFIYNEVGKALSNGSPFVSEALAENIDILLNPRSLKSFKTVSSELPKGSAEKVFLSSSIKEFEMRQSGG